MDGDERGVGGLSGQGQDQGPDDGFDGVGWEPADDGEEVYEWVGGDDEPSPGAFDTPRASAREVLRRLWAGRRAALRPGAGLLTVTAVVAVASVGFTSWFDAVARGADEAAVVSLALDAVADGDPAAVKYDQATGSAVASYVLEVANNGPAAVTVADVTIDAGTLMSSKSWKSVGPPRIPAGGTGRVDVTVGLDCSMLVFGQFMALSRSDGGFVFPNVGLTVRTADGADHKVTLSSRSDVAQDVPPKPENDGQSLPNSAPRIVTASGSVCAPLLQKQLDDGSLAQDVQDPGLAIPQRDPGPVTLTYTGVKQVATPQAQTYVLGFTAHSAVPTAKTTLSAAGGARSMGPMVITLIPAKIEVPAGGDAAFTVRIELQGCASGGGLTLGDITQLTVDTVTGEPTPQTDFAPPGPTPAPSTPSPSGPTDGSPNPFDPFGGNQVSSFGHLMAGTGVQLALDELAQEKAACP